jgi:hypothetical protein
MSVPPFFDHAVPERACSRAINDNGDPCGAEPFLHVAWQDTPEGIEGGWVCTEHARDLHKWKPLQTHEPVPDCGMPGSRWFTDENLCCCPDDDNASLNVISRQEVFADV